MNDYSYEDNGVDYYYYYDYDEPAPGNVLLWFTRTSGPYGPSAARFGSPGDSLSHAPYDLIVVSGYMICETRNVPMKLQTVLFEFGRICATGKAFVLMAVGRNSILNFPTKI